MGSGIYEYYGISCRRRSCAQCTQRAAACGGRLPEGAGRRAPFSCQRALSEGILSGAARVRPAQGRDGDPSCGPTGARRGAARLLRTPARQPRRRQAGSRRCSASGALHPPGLALGAGCFAPRGARRLAPSRGYQVGEAQRASCAALRLLSRGTLVAMPCRGASELLELLRAYHMTGVVVIVARARPLTASDLDLDRAPRYRPKH